MRAPIRLETLRVPLVAVFLLAGCAAPPPPAVQTGPDAVVTEEGLHQVDHSRVALAFVDPAADLSAYTQIMMEPVSIHFKEERGNRILDDETLERIQRRFHLAIVEELQNEGGYRIVDQPGPGVLFLRAALANLVVDAPPEPVSPRSRVYVSQTAEVTLAVELRDGRTGAVLARAFDRRAVAAAGGGMYRSDSVTNQADVDRLFRHWAGLLRRSLDDSRRLDHMRD